MDEHGIRELLAARAQALHSRDAAAFLETYAPEAVIFDLAPPLVHGLDPGGVAAWMASWDGPIGSEIRVSAITVSGPIAFVVGLDRLSGRQGGERRDIWLRFTLGLRHGGEHWRVTHEHVSLPFRKGEKLVAAIDLKP